VTVTHNECAVEYTRCGRNILSPKLSTLYSKLNLNLTSRYDPSADVEKTFKILLVERTTRWQ